MTDKDIITEVLDDLILVLETMDVESYEEDCRDFGLNLLNYVKVLCLERGVDL